jgi:carboxymethylenebutenolidase
MTSQDITADWIDIDGELRGYYAHPVGSGAFPALLLYIEAFGITPHFEDLAQRFAREGYCALVPDIYHGKIYDYSDISNAIDHLKRLDDGQVTDETRRALENMAARPEWAAEHVGAVGFCMGGRLAFLANISQDDRLKGTVSFYGGGIAPKEDMAGRQTLEGRADEAGSPAMLLYGAQDQSILPDEVGRISEALTAANKRFTVHVFPDAGHGFFNDVRQENYHAASARQAWSLTKRFFHDALGG